ncbi:efflux RND transporter periplasmic adaptor subunit [Pelagibaculum spongiae]|uniref:Multidrug resistance protein MdtA-like C-terminal permuted SH3 domain-containing protein n=1 Tax=Pelagibaculum spongiae TaxID=2080658 RepID=A0A2V1H1I9_9GAMM|nr:hypothetical protein [Pelagibaculum spongiae]PVZ71820.1 hypothetical protein DC094_01990 [Pelagibaculum spongiae]
MNILLKKKSWLIILPIIAIFILIVIAKNKPAPEKKTALDNSVLVETIQVQAQTLQPYLIGYGRVQPKETWNARSEVSGRVIYRHPDLEPGKTLPADSLILKIDPVDYQLKLAQAKSDLQSSEAELSRILLNQKKLTLSIKLERNNLQLQQKELQRKQGLLEKNLVSQSLVDAEQQHVFSQQKKLLDIKNNLEQQPASIEIAKAKIAVSQSRISQAQRLLDKTEVRLPFDARIAKVNAENFQLVSPSELMVVAHQVGTMQVPAEVSISQLRQFTAYIKQLELLSPTTPDIQQLNLPAKVILHLGQQTFSWQGKVTSTGESINLRSNTLPLTVDIKPEQQIFNIANRPVLTNEMYVEVRIFAPKQSLIAIPTRALQGQQVYLLDKNQQLQIHKVQPGFQIGNQTIINSGLIGGERLVLNDLVPAVAGMQLRQKINQTTSNQAIGENQ